MIAALDVHYHSDDSATAACVLIDSFESDVPTDHFLATIAKAEPYVPGEFYRRELPCLLAVLEILPQPPDIIIVDSYVDLAGKKGMGRWLYEALDGQIPVIGVAKTQYEGADCETLLRGGSERPVFITAAGMDNLTAKQHISKMSGEFRLPTILKLADQLARGIAKL